jgi:hypothetical protein
MRHYARLRNEEAQAAVDRLPSFTSQVTDNGPDPDVVQFRTA